ncbi:hypothetical protein [Leucobacter soli]|uniref:hypothetical protein n=1 Tax=Leucobacter soli TaxID=2812850 RepID=UPI003613E8F1
MAGGLGDQAAPSSASGARSSESRSCTPETTADLAGVPAARTATAAIRSVPAAGASPTRTSESPLTVPVSSRISARSSEAALGARTMSVMAWPLPFRTPENASKPANSVPAKSISPVSR